ncbi:galactokinase family protein [Pseudonocardia benzenivorans]
MTVGSSTLRAAFARRFDGPPDVVWRAPGRVNLIGEHTDYNDGFVLPWALPLGVSAALRRNDSGVLRMVSLQHGDEVVEAGVADLEPGSVPGWAGYPAGVVWRLRRAGLPVGDAGFDLVVDGDVPAGAGLSSSAALECVVVRAIDDVLGLGLTGPDAAAHARGAENEFVGVPSGVMDQMASLMCAEGCALFLDTRSMATRQVPLDLDPGAGGGSRCCSSTRTHRTGSSTASTPTGSAPAPRAPGHSGCRRCATSRSPASTTPSRASTTRSSAAGCDTSSPRTPGCSTSSACSTPGDPGRSGRCSPPRTRRCATTSRSPCPSWTRPWRRRWTRARSAPG